MEPFSVPWDQVPECPTAAELLSTEPRKLPKNDVDRAPGDKARYLETQYRLIRHEGVELLRRAIHEYREDPKMQESSETAIYTNVTVHGYNVTRLGTLCRIGFFPDRTDKRIRWDYSTRLTPGTVVALSTPRDNFHTICKVATVIQRFIAGGLEPDTKAGDTMTTPPRIDIAWADPNDAVLDPAEHMVMIEAKDGYYESVRHSMRGLQLWSNRDSRFDRYLVMGAKDVNPPEYLEKRRNLIDFSPVFPQPLRPQQNKNKNLKSNKGQVKTLNGKGISTSINMSRPFPAEMSTLTGMDESQLGAIRNILTSELPIIQGPPGTGKTFVSVSAIRILLHNLGWKTPIVIAAQTNHALDQLLVFVHKATKAPFIRLGRRSKSDQVSQRTLFNLRRESKKNFFGGRFNRVEARRKEHSRHIEQLFHQCFPDGFLNPHDLLDNELLTQEQHDSIVNAGWHRGEDTFTENPFGAWLGDAFLVVQKPRFVPASNVYESVRDAETLGDRSGTIDDDEKDRLSGTYHQILEKFKGYVRRDLMKPALWDRVEVILQRYNDLYRVPPDYRGAVYRYLRNRYIKIREEDFRNMLLSSVELANDARAVKAQCDARLIQAHGIPIIGCTTTGLTKYRELLERLEPRVMLIEEAAETREANITSALFDSLEQLILVGDHMQLAPHTDVPGLADAPFNLGVSLFERMVRLDIGHSVLTVQRRMVPEIRQILGPIYPMLTDHPSVADEKVRPPVPGMGKFSTYFLCHSWPEDVTHHLSRVNRDEAQMIGGFVRYLVQNGTSPEKITILTFYKGQVACIRERLARDMVLGNLHATKRYNICTVDGYQGEENDVVILSLVRSPPADAPPSIGFLANQNRAVVAISRARRGFYIFGNYWNLIRASELAKKIWKPVTDVIVNQQRCHRSLRLTCQKHGTVTHIRGQGDWDSIHGGCRAKCSHVYKECGHQCTLLCHPASHNQLPCKKPCARRAPCGHRCSELCGNKCKCALRCKAGASPLGQKKQADSFASLEGWMEMNAPQLQPSKPREAPKFINEEWDVASGWESDGDSDGPESRKGTKIPGAVRWVSARQSAAQTMLGFGRGYDDGDILGDIYNSDDRDRRGNASIKRNHDAAPLRPEVVPPEPTAFEVTTTTIKHVFKEVVVDKNLERRPVRVVHSYSSSGAGGEVTPLPEQPSPLLGNENSSASEVQLPSPASNGGTQEEVVVLDLNASHDSIGLEDFLRKMGQGEDGDEEVKGKEKEDEGGEICNGFAWAGENDDDDDEEEEDEEEEDDIYSETVNLIEL